jgi:hypothetical protein
LHLTRWLRGRWELGVPCLGTVEVGNRLGRTWERGFTVLFWKKLEIDFLRPTEKRMTWDSWTFTPRAYSRVALAPLGSCHANSPHRSRQIHDMDISVFESRSRGTELETFSPDSPPLPTAPLVSSRLGKTLFFERTSFLGRGASARQLSRRQCLSTT